MKSSDNKKKMINNLLLSWKVLRKSASNYTLGNLPIHSQISFFKQQPNLKCKTKFVVSTINYTIITFIKTMKPRELLEDKNTPYALNGTVPH